MSTGAIRELFLTLLVLLLGASYANAQTATYHLHKEASSTTGLNQLKTAGPDATTIALTSVNLKTLVTGEYVIKAFDTQTGVPNVSGVVPAASTVTFTLWMNKTANVGTMFPRAKLNLNNSAGAALCSSTGSSALTTTLTKYTLTCTTAANISIAATDRFYLWVGINLTAGSNSPNFQGSINIEGTLNGNYDSQIVAPLPITPPSISGLSASSGPVGTSITVNGANFGATQGTSLLSFNGVAATPTSWSASSIVAPVPSGATTGPVVVAVRAVPSNGVTFTVTPMINSLSPTSGPAGTSVTISGTTFGTTQGTSIVAFNGTTATPTSWSTSSIAVPVPANATAGPVVVTVSGQASNGVAFTVTPKINSLSPTFGAVGSSVTISGTTFSATQGTSTVTFNGTTATPTSWSATSIAAPVPAGATTGPAVITVSGQASNGVTFTVTPKINSLSPTSGVVGSSVTISGTTFGATQGTSTVTFNGTTTTPTSWSATSIALPVPAGATTGPVVVTVSGQASNGVTFTVTPKINSLSPTSGALGTSVTISGTSFGATQWTSIVTFNGTTAIPTSWSAASIAVSVPTGATTGPVVVTVSGQGSNGVSFTVSPRINSLSPTSGGIATPVTISGASFGTTQGTSTITFNGTAATPTSWSDTSIVAPVPSGATTGPVVVTVGGSPSNGFTLTVISTGTISGRITGADGTAPIPGATVKALQGATIIATTSTNSTGDYTFTPIDAGTYTITALATGYGTNNRSLVVVTGGATATVNLNLDAIVSGPVSYIYDASGRLISTVGPTDTVVYNYDAVGNLLSISRQSSNQVSIIQLSPKSGPVGASVTIHGTGFDPVPTQDTVTFNGVAATVSSATATQLVTSVPAGATTGTVAITNSAGSASSSTAFTVTDGSSGTPTISNFSPAIGEVGNPVTITGSNFETIATNNKLKFNTAPAGISSSTSTSIVGSVPPAGSGHISVTTPSGTATTSSDFYIVPPPRPATDVVFTSRTTLGGGTTNVSITTPGKMGLILFDGQAGQRVALSFTNITMGRVRVSIINPNGTVLAGPIYEYSYPGSAVIDPLVMPITGTYTVLLDTYDPFTGSYSGSLTMQLYNVPPDVTGSLTPGGPSFPVSIAMPGQLARFSFSGTAGRAISLNITGSPVPAGTANIYKPDGSNLIGTTSIGGANLGFIDRQVLPVSGTYTIVIDPQGTNTGSFDVTLYDLVDVSGTITPSGPAVPININTPGQNAALTFDGTANQQVSLAVTGVSMSPATLTSVLIYKPDGTGLAGDNVYSWMNQVVIDAQTLPVSGTYKVVLDPQNASTGNLTVALYNAPDVTDTIATGESKTVTLGVPGQRGKVTFIGNVGQKFSLNMTNATMSSLVSIWKPDGNALIGWTQTPGMIEMSSLPLSGTYTIIVDSQGTSTGSLTLTLYDASDITGTMTVNGSALNITNNPGQNALLSFAGTAGQQVTVRFTNNTIGSILARLHKPDGAVLDGVFSGSSSFNITGTLPTTGTYTVSIDPQYTNAGSITVSVTNP